MAGSLHELRQMELTVRLLTHEESINIMEQDEGLQEEEMQEEEMQEEEL